MYVVVMPRFKAEEQSECDFASDKAIISIYTPTDEPANICKDNKSIKDVLYIPFVDAECIDAEKYPEGWIYSDEQAELVYNFVMKYKNQIECLWIHCDGGVSRSAGMAAAILKALTGDDSQIFDNKEYYPNMTVYRRTLNAFYRN